MSGDNHGGNNHGSGDVVNIFGGQGHTGIVNNPAPPQQQPALEAALRTVVELMEQLRADVGPEDRRSFDEALPVLEADAADPAVETPVRRRALLAVAGIAALLGTAGASLLDAARAALELLGVGG
ncbi:hypothetical protein OG357_20785 [Streptomyces sp. NBC_01255]|uniref:hypothetical protein n=1 Tax=Streptomyces sp. NBC_01255 TaxID=2903798 RepID=UPI002E362501|nr:hypothetical protein [Streptomyces sp. NBC_01255]